MLLFLLACGPKNTTPPPPKVGWYQEETWSHACYHPPEYEKLPELDKMDARSNTLDSMIEQWGGQRSDGISFNESLVTDVETILLGRPEKIEKVSRENLAQCKAVASGANSKDDWSAWLTSLPEILTAGECNNPFTETIFHEIEIDEKFRGNFAVCPGDKVRVKASASDQYRISDNAQWINVEGDKNTSTMNSDLPCNIEGCYAGMFIVRFTDLDGNETVYPIGVERVLEFGRAGSLSHGINDESLYDNIWMKRGTIQDHATVTFSPAQ